MHTSLPQPISSIRPCGEASGETLPPDTGRQNNSLSLPLLDLGGGRQDTLDYFKNSWALTELLFEGLVSEEAFYRRPYHQLRHPMIFYYGHPATLYINKLRVAGPWPDSLHPQFEQLFEVGVDEMRWDDLHEGNEDIWPKVEEVRRYRRQVYDIICNLIETHPLLEPDKLPITQDSPLWALVMSFEHERIHLETSSVLMRELPIELVRKPAKWPDFYTMQSGTNVPDNVMIAVPAATVTLGKPYDWPTFGWDNEYGHESRDVQPFSAGKALISNGEFYEFVKASGYAEQEHWSEEGWEWRRFRNNKWPSFWVQDGPAGSHLYKLRTIFEVIDMQWDWPVCVNYHEAKAYCAWKGTRENVTYRLPSEAEHHVMRKTHLSRHDMVMHSDCLSQGYNLNLATGGESPVQALPANDKGFHDTFGNVWQWCEDHFHPLAGSKPHPYYDDFSMPCYDGQHRMMLGGSFISTGDEASIWARFHFRPHFFQHAGFRLVRSDADVQPRGALTYETQDMLNKYMLMHWGSDQDIMGNVPIVQQALPGIVHLPLACAELVVRNAHGFERALDLGCAVGRSSFELARHFSEVRGIDYSDEFIQSASVLKDKGQLVYSRKNSGIESTMQIAKVDPAIDRSRVGFEQGNACALPGDLPAYDAVLLANVLCRLPDPVVCLRRMQGTNALVKPGGVLVMTTPFSWLEEYTPRSNCLNDIDAIKTILTEFELIHQEELPFLIREHRRKFEYIITQATVWRRNGYTPTSVW